MQYCEVCKEEYMDVVSSQGNSLTVFWCENCGSMVEVYTPKLHAVPVTRIPRISVYARQETKED